MKDLRGYIEEMLRRHTLLNASERSDLTGVLLAAFREAATPRGGETMHELIGRVTVDHEKKHGQIPACVELDHAMHDAILPYLADIVNAARPSGEPGDTGGEDFVEWVEPFGPKNEPVFMRVPVSTAIAHAKAAAKQQRPEFVYANDQQALDDFITVHWATLIPAAHPQPSGVTDEQLGELADGLRKNCPILCDDVYWTLNGKRGVMDRIRAAMRATQQGAGEGKS